MMLIQSKSLVEIKENIGLSRFSLSEILKTDGLFGKQGLKDIRNLELQPGSGPLTTVLAVG